MMCVSSVQLDAMAQSLRRRKRGAWLWGNTSTVYVTPAQLEKAAQILRDAKPSVIEKVSGHVTGRLVVDDRAQECPGFIHEDRQDDPSVLVFDVGILPCETYRIGPRGRQIPTVQG